MVRMRNGSMGEIASKGEVMALLGQYIDMAFANSGRLRVRR
jgi:hypothetical protein